MKLERQRDNFISQQEDLMRELEERTDNVQQLMYSQQQKSSVQTGRASMAGRIVKRKDMSSLSIAAD